MASLLVLHGYTMNGAVMREHLGALASRLSTHVDLVFPDAPHLCSEATVARLYALSKARRLQGPHRTWWDATDDGREYRGWEETYALVREHMRDDAVGVL